MMSTYELQIAINGLLKSDSSRIWPVARSRLRCGARSKPRLIVSERIAKLSSCCAVIGASRLMLISRYRPHTRARLCVYVIESSGIARAALRQGFCELQIADCRL